MKRNRLFTTNYRSSKTWRTRTRKTMKIIIDWKNHYNCPSANSRANSLSASCLPTNLLPSLARRNCRSLGYEKSSNTKRKWSVKSNQIMKWPKKKCSSSSLIRIPLTGSSRNYLRIMNTPNPRSMPSRRKNSGLRKSCRKHRSSCRGFNETSKKLWRAVESE